MSSAVVFSADTRALERLEVRAWREGLLAAKGDGARMVSLWGRREGASALVTALVELANGSMQAFVTEVSVERGYHELTTSWPALHCFERELHEQTGVRIAGHPWLKPIRYAGLPQAAMNAYPFYVIEGKEVHEVAVGPVHAGVIEPGSFRFMCHGEQVHHLEIHLGYQHRGVEQRLLEGDPRRLAPLVETIAGDTSVAHAWAYCAAIEDLVGVELAGEVDVARAVALELERVAMHLAGLAGLAADVGFLQGASTYGRLRTTAINTTMKLCGSRFGRGALRPGGTGMVLSESLAREVAANVALMQRDLTLINACFLSARTVQHRLQGAGVLSSDQASELGVVGMAARASGVLLDLRQGRAAGAYADEPLKAVVCAEGDCWARGLVRIREMDESLAWLARVLARAGRWDAPRQVVHHLQPERLVVARVEGWRGEVVHCLETDRAGRLAHYKVQDPSLRNWMGLAIAVRKNEISDFPICNKSFDLSYCGNDL